MADLKGTLELLMKRLYGEDTQIRLRPHHFHTQSLLLKLTLCASTAMARVVQCASRRAG